MIDISCLHYSSQRLAAPGSNKLPWPQKDWKLDPQPCASCFNWKHVLRTFHAYVLWDDMFLGEGKQHVADLLHESHNRSFWIKICFAGWAQWGRKAHSRETCPVCCQEWSPIWGYYKTAQSSRRSLQVSLMSSLVILSSEGAFSYAHSVK